MGNVLKLTPFQDMIQYNSNFKWRNNMKALLFEEIGRLSYIDMPDPVISKPDDVLVRIRASSICGSDVHGFKGLPPGRVPPLVMGHESCGEVVEIGSAVENVKIGDRIFILPGISCNTCEACLDGRFDDCRDRRFYGADMPGGFAEYVLISARAAVPLPDNVPYTSAALIEPLSVALKIVSKLGVTPDDTVAVIGAGPIGLMSIAVLARFSPRHLIVLNRNPNRQALANEYGATVHINPTAGDVWVEVSTLTDGIGVDGCVEAVGTSETMNHAIDITRPGGTIVWAGNMQNMVNINQIKAVFNQLTIKGSMGTTRSLVLRTIRLIASGSIAVDKLLTIEAPLSEGASIFERMTEDRSIIKAVLIP
jgi:2-desacetyl-2-hydroxyethyl bacteriochlorophyllide A dehydrogenase